MTPTKPMTALRRRPMPGMPAAPAKPDPGRPHLPEADVASATTVVSKPRRRLSAGSDRVDPVVRRHPVDYSATHLANFRLPVNLRARYADLIAKAQERHPQLRKMSLTEVLIALMAEGPQTPDEVAELVRRKRADEHGEGTRR